MGGAGATFFRSLIAGVDVQIESWRAWVASDFRRPRSVAPAEARYQFRELEIMDAA